MDTTTPVNHISLCAGYCGIDLGLRDVIPSLRTIAYSEIEAFALANLVSKMEAGLLDAAPVWTNLKTFPWAKFRGRVGILTGGYPCQPFSAAGSRKGHEDERHLWPYILEGIKQCLPDVCFFENVEGHISLGLREVLADLEDAGYWKTWGIFSAAEVGLKHGRKRIFILAVANNNNSRLEGHTGNGLRVQEPGWFFAQASRFAPEDGLLVCSPAGPGEPQYEWEPPRTVGDSIRNGQPQCAGSIGEIRDRTEHTSEAMGDTESRRTLSEEQSGQSHGGECSSQTVGDTSSRNGQRETQRQSGHAAQSDQNLADAADSGLGQRRKGSGSALQRQCSERDAQLSEPEYAGELSGRLEGLGWPEFPVCWVCAKSIYWDAPRGCGCSLSAENCCDQCGVRIEECQCGAEELEYSAEPGLSQWSSGEEGRSEEEQEPERPDGSGERETQPSLGRDADGNFDWLDDAELYTSSDNRTDELRLCGNGVVPATARKAFIILARQLHAEITGLAFLE